MRTFTLIWLGQLVSTIGNHMTDFALVLWAWQLTGSATALALVGFFYEVAQLPTALLAGVIVDRCDRKQLIILSDAIAALSTLCISLLYLSGHLQLWHIYALAAINGSFGQLQRLAYKASISLLLSPCHYTRANSMNAAVHYGSSIIAPALAGTLYPLTGLLGILWIDLATFGMAIATLLFCTIPQPTKESVTTSSPLLSQLTFGFRHLWQQADLRSLLFMTTLFWFFHDLGESVYDPMLLAQTNGSAEVLAQTSVAAGVGGVIGAIVISVWGGPQKRTTALFSGFIGAGISKTCFGLGRSPSVWIPAQVCSSLNFPLLGSAEDALWMQKTAPEIQGRVFAANALVTGSVSAIAALIAGPLADKVFEPMMQSSTATMHWLSFVFGTETGAGLSVLYMLCGLEMLLIGFIGSRRWLAGRLSS